MARGNSCGEPGELIPNALASPAPPQAAMPQTQAAADDDLESQQGAGSVKSTVVTVM